MNTGYAARQEMRGSSPRLSGGRLGGAGILMGSIRIGLVPLVLCASLALLIVGFGMWISLESQ